MGNLVVSADPSGGPATWSQVALGTTRTFAGISCPGVSLCLAADSLGTVFVSQNPTGGSGAWTPVPVSHTFVPNLEGISCPSVQLCVVLSENGYAATSDPSTDASQWSPSTIDPVAAADPVASSDWSIDCSSITLCAVAASRGSNGYVLTSTDPAAASPTWTAEKVSSAQIRDVTCASTSTCIAADADGATFVTTDPTDASPVWTRAQSDAGATDMQCPSTNLCLGVAKDNLASTTIPAFPTGSWSSFTIDPLSCSSSEACFAETLFAVDDDGVRQLDAAGQSATSQITGLSLSGNTVSWTHDGAAHQVTLH